MIRFTIRYLFFDKLIMETKNVRFENIRCAGHMTSVFGGHGKGEIICKEIQSKEINCVSDVDGIKVK